MFICTDKKRVNVYGDKTMDCNDTPLLESHKKKLKQR